VSDVIIIIVVHVLRCINYPLDNGSLLSLRLTIRFVRNEYVFLVRANRTRLYGSPDPSRQPRLVGVHLNIS